MSKILKSAFKDLDHMSSMLKKWDLEVIQLSHGPFYGELGVITIGPLIIHSAKLNQKTRILGLAPEGHYSFTILARGSSPLNSRSNMLAESQVAVYSNDREVVSTSRAGFHVYSVLVPRGEAEKTFQRLDMPGGARLFTDTGVLSCDQNYLHKRNADIEKLFDLCSKNCGQGLDPAVEQYWAERFLDDFFNTLKGSTPVTRAHSQYKRAQIVNAAESYILQKGGRPISIGHLSKVTGVSKRTLQYAFQDYFDLSPLQYSKAHRLKLARRALYQADSSSTLVADVARQLGFNHLGQFSADYKRQFGELPSHTLAR